MKIRLHLCAGALLLVCTAAVFAQDEASVEYAKLMTPAAMANATLQKSVKAGDLKAAASSAADTQQAFARIEQYWAANGAADAQRFARNIEQDAKQAQAAAAAGKKEDAEAAAGKIVGNCAMCHMAHRTMLDDGTFKLK